MTALKLWDTSVKTKVEKTLNTRIIGNFSQISSICERAQIDKIIVALDERRGKLPVEQLLYCRVKGIQIVDGVGFTEEIAGKLAVENLHPSFLIFSSGFKGSAIYKRVKRLADLIFSVLGLTLSSPLILMIAAAIKFDSKGPIFYRQERVGEDERTFELIKFRSMRIGAEQNGPVWAMPNDKRVTRVGQIIRKLRVDEIPQMINVLRGEMSFVGPRPERPFFVERLKKEIPFYIHRHSVKPGITGWAQISYRYGASKEDALEKLKYDLYYIKHMSPFLDLMIISETVKIVLFGRGAR
jgi:sugar transferase (PEP-CTERM system associated)